MAGLSCSTPVVKKWSKHGTDQREVWLQHRKLDCKAGGNQSGQRCTPMKTMDGAISSATRNSSRTSFGPSPRYFCISSEPTTRRKLAEVEWATALASSVLPVPGSPYRMTPCSPSVSVLSSWQARQGLGAVSEDHADDRGHTHTHKHTHTHTFQSYWRDAAKHLAGSLSLFLKAQESP